MIFHPFIIHIDLCDSGDICVSAQYMGVSRSHRLGRSDLPVSQEELVLSAEWLKSGHIDNSYAHELGARLFHLLFQGDVLHLLRDAEARLGDLDGLRLLLQLPTGTAGKNALANDLARLPWELMYDERYGFLSLSSVIPLVHHDPGANLPNRVPDGSMPLRVLLIAASPKNSAPLQSAKESKAILETLTKPQRLDYRLRLAGRHIKRHGTLRGLPSRLRNLHRFEVTTLLEATRRDIRQAMDKARGEEEPYHAVHFIGHGEFSNGISYLLLHSENAEGGIDRICGEEFIDLIADPHINLLVFNACQTAAVNPVMASVAEQGLQRGIPVVIGMRMNVYDDSAIFFARDFYSTLATGQPVETAMASARQLTKREARGQEVDWSIPRIFMGWSEGLTLPVMNVHRLTVLQKAWRVVLGLVTLVGIVSMLVGLPTLGRTIATEVPGIKCLELSPMDENKFTVAFYPFGVVDENGRTILTDDGGDLAQYLFNRFEKSFAELDFDIPYELRPPAHACAIRGKDREERADSAAESAEKIKADIIIYGTITDANVDPRLNLEFHVSYQGFSEGDEITGPYALGDQLPVDLPFDPESLSVIAHPAHIVWTDILSAITIGLSYYSADDFESALHYLETAEQIQQWPKSDGKEIVHLLLGNAHLRLASREKSLEGFYAAREQYQKALDIDPAYTRAKVGEANTIYLLALGDPGNPQVEDFDEGMLDDAEEEYLEALTAARISDDQTSISRITFGLGQIYLARALKHDANNLSESDSLTICRGAV